MAKSDRFSINQQLSAIQAAFVIIVSIGVLLRLLNLSGKFFWIDEAFTAFRLSGFTESDLLQAWTDAPLITAGDLLQYQFPAAGTSFVTTIRELAVHEPQLPPLYFVLTRWWVQLLGDSIATIRSFSVLTSIAALPMLALLSRELFVSKLPAYIAVALMAVSPFQVLYAQEARPYSLWTLGVIAMSWSLLWALRSRTWQVWLIYGVLTTLTLYTFVYTVFVLLAHSVYVGWQQRSHWRPFSVTAGLSALLFLPWVGVIVQNRQAGLDSTAWQLQSAQQQYLTLPLQWLLNITRSFVDFEQTYAFGFNQLWPYGLVVLGAIAGVSYSVYRLVKTTPPDCWGFLLLLVVIPA
ncbi:MAG: glycosyltransferase family 39 protein, partial [Cyanobacteria bacterium P01_C01_bin.120]